MAGKHRTKEELSAIFSKNLKYYMEEKGIDRAELARFLGVSHTVATEWFNGTKYPRIDKIQVLADYFQVSITDLIEDHDELEQKDEELIMLRDKLRNSPELRILFDLSDKATTRDMRVAIKTLQALTENK